MITPELSILRLFLKHSIYQQYRRYVRISPEMRELQILYHTLDLLHKKFPEVDKTFDELESMVFVAYPMMKAPEKEALGVLLQKARQLEVSEEVLGDLVKSLQVRGTASELALRALDVAEGRATPDTLSDIWTRLQAPQEVLEDDAAYFITDDLESLGNSVVYSVGLHWRLASLNRSLGPLRPGDFGFVFARPETGKTTFLAAEGTFMAGQANNPIVWFNNEEQGEKVRLRTYQAALGVSLDQLWEDKKGNFEKYRQLTGGKLCIYDDANIHKKDVERVIDRLKPEVIIFDQIDKIRGFDADRPDLVYGRIYQWARELAKTRRCAVIGVCQSDGSGEGVRWLTMANVADAKTSKQAEADWILGIGRSNDGGTEDVRYLNISKNKLLGDSNTDPRERHGRFQVFLHPEIARYEDL